MKCSFSAEVSCMLVFTDAQWNLIMESFCNHYDWELKGAPAYGGWLYGLNNQRKFSNDTENWELQFTFRQVDLIIKSLELDRSEIARDLDKKLRGVITMLTGASAMANLVLKPLTVADV